MERQLDAFDREGGQPPIIDQVVTLSEACAMLNVSKSYLRSRLWRGWITYRLVGRHYIVSVASLKRFAQKEGIHVVQLP